MSALKLTAKFRIKNGIPFAIETLSGTQYRCGICRKVFFDRKELENHLKKEKSDVDFNFPEINKNICVNVVYSTDLRDLTNPEHPRLNKGEKLLKIRER